MTDPQDALDLTLKLFKINASKLSEAAGLHKSVISRYRVSIPKRVSEALNLLFNLATSEIRPRFNP